MPDAEVKTSYSFERGEAIYLAVGSVIRIAIDWSQRDHGMVELPIEEWTRFKTKVDSLIAARDRALSPPEDNRNE